jgi:hypothetical protein
VAHEKKSRPRDFAIGGEPHGLCGGRDGHGVAVPFDLDALRPAALGVRDEKDAEAVGAAEAQE